MIAIDNKFKMIIFPTNQKKTNRLSLLSVYLQSTVFYDEIYSFFALIFQYFIFVYKYNILHYDSGVIAGEIILLSLLLAANWIRIGLARGGNRAKRYSYLALFLLLDVLLVVGYIYIVAIQPNALYLEVIISLIGLVFSATSFILTIALMIVYRINQ